MRYCVSLTFAWNLVILFVYDLNLKSQDFFVLWPIPQVLRFCVSITFTWNLVILCVYDLYLKSGGLVFLWSLLKISRFFVSMTFTWNLVILWVYDLYLKSGDFVCLWLSGVHSNCSLKIRTNIQKKGSHDLQKNCVNISKFLS